MYLYKTLIMLVVVMLASISCKKNDGVEPQLTILTSKISFEPEGGTSDISFSTNGAWTILNGAAWLHLSQGTGAGGDNTVTLTADENGSGFSRSVIIILESKNGQARRIKVTQTGDLYPSYNLTPKPADATGMPSTATELIAKMNLGINIGNTLELININPDPTEDNIKFIKQMGFDAVRLPCGWNQNVEDYNKDTPTENKAKIKAEYIAKVKQVVQWCVENDLYVLVNIHWDGGWLENNIASNKQEEVNARQKALWEQIATALRDFDEHVLFVSANEPNADDDAETAILLTYHKTFVDAVRSTGGRNTYRTLVLQGHDDYISPEDFAALNDPTPNRLAFEWHNYTPSSMTILSDDAPIGWDNVRFYWGEGNHVAGLENGIDRNCSYGEEAELLEGYNKIKTRFIDKGIPCLMGEFSSQRWNATSKFVPQDLDKHNKSVDDWYTFQVKQCKAIGGVPFVWDTGGIFHRSTNTVNDQRSLDAIMAGL
jgi:endoglucanase